MTSESCSTDRMFECCLFFTANSLARAITRLGEECFAAVGMTPSYAFLLLLAEERPGIAQKELAEALRLAPSTVSRFVDALVRRGLLSKEGEGRNVLVRLTSDGEAAIPTIRAAWRRLHDGYSDALGTDLGETLTCLTNEAARKLEGHE